MMISIVTYDDDGLKKQKNGGVIMKKMWLIGMALPLLLVTGCSVDNAKVKGENAPITKNQDVELKSVSKEEYVKLIGEYQKSITNEFKTLGTLTNATDDPDYVQKNVEQIKKVKAVVAKYKSLNPPTEFKDVQHNYLEATKHFDTGLDLLSSSIKNADKNKVEQAKAELTKGQDYWNYAFNQLAMTENVSIGNDGTLGTKDLKSLDKNAGIDRDSVMTNISKDGKELVGKWGSVNEKNQLVIQIVLGADGSYKRYKSYPDESSILNGTWKYDYLTHTMTFTNDEAYEDGKSIKSTTRAKLELDVQSFSGTEMQFMDKESLHTMKYTKEGAKNAKPAEKPQIAVGEPNSAAPDAPVKQDPDAPSSVSQDQILGFWHGLRDDMAIITFTLEKNGTFNRTENVYGKDLVLISGSWSYDKEKKTILFKNKEAKYDTSKETLKYPSETIYAVNSVNGKELNLTVDNGMKAELKR